MKSYVRTRCAVLAGVSLTALALAAAPSMGLAQTQTPQNAFANPPAALPEAEPSPLRLSTPKGLVQAPPPITQAADTFVDPRQNILYKFSIEFTDGTVRNPWTLSQDKVRLRSYRGSAVDPNTPFLAPTITMRPGQTVRISLANNLFETKDGQRVPPVKCKTPDGGVNVPHCFNDTNLHAHGLWVSPSGNSDNVLISINPGVTFDYEYNVPSDHAAGTFWYHPHKHGSTALQVSSGMAGALIIKDDRVPTAATPGDIDVLLQDARGAAFPDKVLMFQQVQYACFDANGKIQTSPGGAQPWVCNPGQTGEIRDYAQQLAFSASWANSGRFTSINGRVQPGVTGLRAGVFERWRLIHGGVREAVNFRLFPMKPGAPNWNTVPAKDQAAFMRTFCAGTALPMWEVAVDGLTRSQVFRTTETRLQPGYRADMVVYFPTGGNYCIIDGASDALGSPSQQAEPIKLLGVAVVEPGAPAGDPDRALQNLMIGAAERNIADPRVKEVVIRDLLRNLTLSKFVWHPTITKEQLNAPPQILAFNIRANPVKPGTLFEVNNPALPPDRSGQYVPSRIDRTANIGDVQEWRLTSTAASHPFHIHVNPFQVVSVVNRAGKSVTDPGTPDFDPDYAGVIDQWKDTLFVKANYQIVTRTRYERYIGEYVLHCHILDHEDQGMMANVAIGIPDGLGGTAEAHGPGGHMDHGEH